MDSKHQNGLVSELKAMAHFAEQGYEIYKPHSGQSSIDFIAFEQKLGLLKVQVKSAYWFKRPTDAEYLQSTVRKGAGSDGYDNYTKEECDVFAIYGDGKLWVIPREVVGTAQTINLDKRGPHQRKSQTDFSEFLVYVDHKGQNVLDTRWVS